MPSTGCGSIASTASENSLARMPVVCTNSAMAPANGPRPTTTTNRSEEHTSELQSLMRISYAVFCLKKKKQKENNNKKYKANRHTKTKHNTDSTQKKIKGDHRKTH